MDSRQQNGSHCGDQPEQRSNRHPQEHTGPGGPHVYQLQREQPEGNAAGCTGNADHCRLDGCLGDSLGEVRSTDAKEGLLPTPPANTCIRDRDRDQDGEHYAGRTKKQEEHIGVERVAANAVEARREIVGYRRTASHPGLEIVGHFAHRREGADGIVWQARPIKKDMQLRTHRVRPRDPLRVEQLMPLRNRQE